MQLPTPLLGTSPDKLAWGPAPRQAIIYTQQYYFRYNIHKLLIVLFIIK
jgi:hypothetical protein